MSEPHASSPKKGFFTWLKNLFSGKGKAGSDKPLYEHGRHLEPKYWQEVIDFMDSIKGIIDKNTIDDENIRHVNDRIITYVADQINKKGEMKDRAERYAALDTLADRILVNNLSKIAGLKHTEGRAFTDAVKQFKDSLHRRKAEEDKMTKSS